jgi:two-component system cell cycle response regulator DivK
MDGDEGGGATVPKPRVLIIDDNALNRKLVTTLLRNRGFEIEEADSAESGSEILSRSRIAVVLMDVRLPGTDGLELTRLLRADPKHRSLIIVAITANAFAADRDAALAAGCDAYVSKPIDTAGLVPLLIGLLASRAEDEHPRARS